jgi:hypothetical protein
MLDGDPAMLRYYHCGIPWELVPVAGGRNFSRCHSITNLYLGSFAVARSVLEAIKQGDWDFEPEAAAGTPEAGTAALPGTAEKLDVLAERLRAGQPLWNPTDRRSYDDRDDE